MKTRAVYFPEANKFDNILGPVTNNMGHVLYVLLAVVGATLALSGAGNVSLTGSGVMTLGVIASFMQLSRTFVMPISQVTQQISAVVMALAGAERIFQLLDEESEQDEGYVTLVNAKEENGQLTETQKRTRRWACGVTTSTAVPGACPASISKRALRPCRSLTSSATRSTSCSRPTNGSMRPWRDSSLRLLA